MLSGIASLTDEAVSRYNVLEGERAKRDFGYLGSLFGSQAISLGIALICLLGILAVLILLIEVQPSGWDKVATALISLLSAIVGYLFGAAPRRR